MSGNSPNSRTDSIVETDGYIRYAGPYSDDYDNPWRVTILGQRKDVWSIMKERRFVLNAIPEDDFDAFHAQIKQALLWQDDEKGAVDYEEDDGPQMPGLLVEIVLEELVRKDQRHAIQIEFDPDIWDSPHHWRIYLNPPQKNFHFRIEKKQGSVTSTKSSSDSGAQWNATVFRVTGNPAKYNMKSAAFQV